MTSEKTESRESGPAVLCAGILVADLFLPPMEALPEAGELRATDDFLLDTGGCAANVATSLTRLGVTGAVAGCVGRDAFGDFIVRDLGEKDIDTSSIRRSTHRRTSKTVILTVTGEDRRFIHTFGANVEFRAEDIPRSLPSPEGVLYFGGYLAMPGVLPDPLGDLLQAARARNVRTVLDVVVPADGASDSMELLLPVLPHVDVFLPNEDEARALSGETDPRRQAERFLNAGCGIAVITRGSVGTLLMSDQTVLEMPPYPVDFVDGSGAGDAFAAGFIVGLLERRYLSETLRFAGAVGASACAKLGCTTGVFDREQAEACIRAHPLEVRECPL